jgi:hypothetical protein
MRHGTLGRPPALRHAIGNRAQASEVSSGSLQICQVGPGLDRHPKAPAAGPRRSAPDPGRVRDLPTEANQLAAVARSLRAKMMTARIGGSVTAGVIADIVGQIELLADSVAALLED